MRHVAVVESKGQQRLHELSLDGHRSVVIGRGWDSDIVVNDEFVDAAHLELRRSETGELLVEDRGTLNGTRIGKRPLKGRAVCDDGTRLSLGETTITVHEAGAGVPPASRFDAVNVLARRFDSVLWTIPAAAIAVAALLGELLVLGATEIDGEGVVESLAGFGLLALAWCLVGGMIGKVLRHRAHFGLHWIALCLIVAVAFVLDVAAGLLAFNVDSDAFDHVLRPTLQATLAFVLCYAFLSLSTRLRRRWRTALGTLAGAFPIVFSLVLPALQDEHERWTSVAVAEPVGQPAGTLFVAPTTVDAHFESVAGLFAELEGVDPAPGTARDDEPVDGGDGARLLSSDADEAFRSSP